MGRSYEKFQEKGEQSLCFQKGTFFLAHPLISSDAAPVGMLYQRAKMLGNESQMFGHRRCWGKGS